MFKFSELRFSDEYVQNTFKTTDFLVEKVEKLRSNVGFTQNVIIVSLIKLALEHNFTPAPDFNYIPYVAHFDAPIRQKAINPVNIFLKKDLDEKVINFAKANDLKKATAIKRLMTTAITYHYNEQMSYVGLKKIDSNVFNLF